MSASSPEPQMRSWMSRSARPVAAARAASRRSGWKRQTTLPRSKKMRSGPVMTGQPPNRDGRALAQGLAERAGYLAQGRAGLIEDARHAQEAMEHPRVLGQRHRDPRVAQPHRIGFAVVAERVAPGGDHERGR